MKITPNQFAWIFLIVLVGLIGWGGYAIYQFFQNPSAKIISIENEVKLGEAIENQTMMGMNEVKNSFTDSCINIIHDRLMDGLGTSNYTYVLKIVDQDDANAFAIPGGKIFIHTGLIEFCNSPEELAAVLAHEMGHVEKRHTVKNIIQDIGLSALIAMITDGGGSGIESISNQLMSGYFSREDEAEADDFALSLLEKCGIQPTHLGEVFSRMKEKYGDMEGAMNLLSSHPELGQRAEKSASFQVSTGFNQRKINMDWEQLQLAMKTQR
jgi:predicted Zn-dependent protease